MQIIGTTRVLTNVERSNIITEILNKYAFGNYLNYENNVWLCKLKNRGLDKNVELSISSKSYSMIGEIVLEHKKNQKDSNMVKMLRNLYTNLKNEAVEYNKARKKNKDNIAFDKSISFTFYGKKYEYKYFEKIIKEIRWEFEDALSKYINHNINLEVVNGIYRKSKATSLFIIKEAK